MTKQSIRKQVPAFNEKEIKSELDRRHADLSIARRIQQQFIPRNPLRINGYTVSSLYLPSYYLSGDFFDYVIVGKNCVCIFVIDVIGKGIEASFTTLLIKSIFQKIIATHNPLEPRAIVSALNAAMCSEITLMNRGGYGFYGVIDTKAHTLTYSDCGIGVATHYTNTHELELKSEGGVGIGLFDNSQYTQEVITLKKDDILVISTDGIEDAKDKDGDRIGRRWLDELIVRYKQEIISKPLVSQIEYSIKELVKESASDFFEDDIACVCVSC